jgi:hypothetical protein
VCKKREKLSWVLRLLACKGKKISVRFFGVSCTWNNALRMKLKSIIKCIVINGFHGKTNFCVRYFNFSLSLLVCSPQHLETMRIWDEIYLTQIYLSTHRNNQQFMSLSISLKVDPQLISFHTDTFMMDVPIAKRRALIDSHKQSIKGNSSHERGRLKARRVGKQMRDKFVVSIHWITIL